MRRYCTITSATRAGKQRSFETIPIINKVTTPCVAQVKKNEARRDTTKLNKDSGLDPNKEKLSQSSSRREAGEARFQRGRLASLQQAQHQTNPGIQLHCQTSSPIPSHTVVIWWSLDPRHRNLNTRSRIPLSLFPALTAFTS